MSVQALEKPPVKFDHHPAAKHAPARDYSYLTEGHEIAKLARLLGKELMPWQRQVVDVATEYRLDTWGRRIYHYPKVLITVPRQSGKTLLMGPVKLHRIMTRPGINCFSTAQTGKDAGKRMMDLIKLVAGSPLAGIFKPRKSNGSEGLEVRQTGAHVTRFSPTLGAIHGETPHLVDYDEIWKYSEELGDNLLGGVGPAQITLHGQAQIWMISTRGTAASVFMNKWVKSGRDGTAPGLAYFEWSMPDGADPDDPATWWAFHPALGNTITEDALRAEMYGDGMTHAERMRGYMNVLTEAEDPVITPEDWAQLHTAPEGMPARSDLAISYEVAPGNVRAAVLASWRDDAGMACTRVLHSAPGTIWLPGYVRRLAAAWKPAVIAADDGGPARRVTDELTNPTEAQQAAGVEALEILTPGMRDYGTACDAWLTAARDDRTFRHDGSEVFAQAMARVVLRTNNGTERIDRDKSAGPVAEVIGSIVGIWAYDHRPEETGNQIW